MVTVANLSAGNIGGGASAPQGPKTALSKVLDNGIRIQMSTRADPRAGVLKTSPIAI